jgi:alpha-N-arabinofuranosidase
MANIAQTVNVLQSMVLTDREKMLLTPTYHVFEMYKMHQGATSLPLELSSPDYVRGEHRIPAVSAGASRAAGGRVHLSLVNADPSRDAAVSCELRGFAPARVSGRILTAAAMSAHNTFAAPGTVQPRPFAGATLDSGRLKIALPAKSVVVLEW